ncbi:MAG: RNB domain-containing ribonuclease, partial [Lactobacillus iners]|nr:RNB domain-containing ribonuclease [Lactobacillus iners]
MPQDERVLASIYEVFRHNSQKSYTIDKLDRELHNKLHYKFTELVRGVTFLEHEKKIITDGLGKYQLNRLDTIVEGTFRANDKGFGFIRYDEVADDIFVDKTNTSFAIDGDTVKAKIIADANPWNGKGPEGQVVEIIERGFENLVGEFIPFSDQQVATTNYLGYVISENKKLKKYKIYILKDGLTPQLGDIVQVSLKTYPSEESPEDMTAVVIKVIGNKNDPGVDIMAIVADHDVKTEWSDEALEQANQIPDHVTAADKAGREDITQQAAVTIDGDDSKDFDDAVVLWKLDNGNYHLGVHIADVAHYVTEGSPLDIEAFTRGNSTYLVDRVIPMLPFRLSN